MDVSTILIGQENERRSNAMKKNKTIFILLLFILTISLVGCAKQENNKDVGVFEGVVSWDINLDTYLGYPIHDAIDEKLALDIGNVVIRSIYGEEILKKTDFLVCEPEGHDFYIVSRMPKDKKMLGDDYNVAISRIDGRILKVWAGE